MTNNIQKDTIEILNTAIETILNLSEQLYTNPDKAISTSSIGAHFRHIFDHYDNFLNAQNTPKFTYDTRTRDIKLEQNQAYTCTQFNIIIDQIKSLTDVQLQEPVTIETNSGSGPSELRSSRLRELQFLLSHTLHHFAMIKMVATHNNHPLPEEFGIAPSTLRHLEAQKKPA